MNDFVFICLCTFFSVAPIFSSVIVRDSVKRHRQSIIRDLTVFFGSKTNKKATSPEGPEDDSSNDLLRSFEFVKFKYFLATESSEEAVKNQAILKKVNTNGPSANQASTVSPDDFRPDEWIILSLPLIILLYIACYFSLTILASLAEQSVDTIVPTEFLNFFICHRSVSMTILASLIGAYTFMIRAFFQAINNFDLTPASFLGACNNIIFGVALTQIATFHLSKNADGSSLATGILVVTAFVGGYMPDSILRYLLHTGLIKHFKEERSGFGIDGESVSVEALDGIDSQIRYRLSDFHISTVQNLAAANPIMLFVETPYGIYQMLDWVAQAQLCVSVGPDALFRLWKIGIRTIFDLERLAFCDGFKDDRILQAVERIILPQLPEVTAGTKWNDEAIVSSIRTRVDATYTHRLRQIVMRVTDQLGGDGTRYLPGIVIVRATQN